MLSAGVKSAEPFTAIHKLSTVISPALVHAIAHFDLASATCWCA